MAHGRQAGFTLPEVAIMSFVMSALLVMIAQSIASLSSVRSDHKQHANIGNVADRIARSVERDVEYATRVFTNTPDDLAYLRATVIGQKLLVQGCRLPTLTNLGLFDHDPPATPQTGCVVFLGTRGARISITFNGTVDSERLVQSLVLVIYAPIVGASGDRDLLRWVSRPMASYWDIAEITDPVQRADAISRLYDSGVRIAWDPDQPRNTGLFELQQGGAMVPLLPTALLPGSEDVQLSRLLLQRNMRVAPNGNLPGIQVPEFADVVGAFPGGVEVKVDGAGKGRLLLFRLVIDSTQKQLRHVFSEVRRLINTDC